MAFDGLAGHDGVMANPTPRETTSRLERPRDGRIIAGVAAGLAQRYDIEVIWIRLAFVILAMFGGTGVLVYLAGWLLIPEQGESESIIGAGVGDLEGLSGWLGVALIVTGGLIIFSWTGVVQPSVLWAAALIVFGVLLYRGDLPPIGGSKPAPNAEAPIYGRDPVEADADELATGPIDTAPPTASTTLVAPPPTPAPGVAAPPPPPPPSPPRPKSILGRMTIAVGLIAIGAMTLLDTANIINPTLRHYLAVAIGIAGIGLLVGTLWGRSWGLIVLGLILMPALIAATVVRVPLRGSFGERNYQPETIADIPAEYELAAGSLKVDLRDIGLDDGPVVIVATVGFGELVVLVPADAATTIDARSGFGEVVIDGTSSGGINVVRSADWPGTGSIIVDLEVGFGSARIERAGF
jgi:phage shock protein PspC (stress-responsive transcriptional regulator)